LYQSLGGIGEAGVLGGEVDAEEAGLAIEFTGVEPEGLLGEEAVCQFLRGEGKK
jgi:hypothetical protein